jgi:hypothetical protein
MLPKPIYIAWCISAYFPLILYFGFTADNIYLQTWFFSITFLSIYFLVLLVKSVRTDLKPLSAVVKHSERVYGDSLAYLIPYLAMFIDWESYLLQFRILFIALILVYQQGDIFYVHPLLKLFGFYIYHVYLTSSTGESYYKYPKYLITRQKTHPTGSINCYFISSEWLISLDRS